MCQGAEGGHVKKHVTDVTRERQLSECVFSCLKVCELKLIVLCDREEKANKGYFDITGYSRRLTVDVTLLLPIRSTKACSTGFLGHSRLSDCCQLLQDASVLPQVCVESQKMPVQGVPAVPIVLIVW